MKLDSLLFNQVVLITRYCLYFNDIENNKKKVFKKKLGN